MTTHETRPDPDRLWILRAARGEIDTPAALDTVRAMHMAINLPTSDPELYAAMLEGDAAHPDIDRQPLGDEPWLQDTQPDPETTEAFDQLVDRLDNDPDDADHQPFLNWHDLFTEETPDEEWLYDGVFAIGRGHALYAEHKQGKSLFVLWICTQLATTRTDVDIIYLDYEMTRSDVRERLEDMGYSTESDLTHFHYALLPTLPPLDTGEGLSAILELIELVERPNAHILVVVDTTSRAAQGKENDADTFRDFYRWTGIALKRRGITWARLDHAGKDPFRGQRGSSGKGDDVDVIWKLIAEDGGITIHRDAARMPWVDDKISYTIHTNPLRYERGHTWPAGTKELATQLDDLNVPTDAGRPTARRALKEADLHATNTVLAAALKWRRQEAQKLSVLITDSENENAPDTSPDTTGQPPQNPTSQPPDLSTDRNGQEPAARGPVSVSIDTDRPSGPVIHTLTCSRCPRPATDISGLCAGCLANPGQLPPLNRNELF